MGSLNPMTLLLLVVALNARRAEHGREEVAPGGGTNANSGGPGGPTGGSGGVNARHKIPPFRHMLKSQATSWAHSIGLKANFQGHGRVVVKQEPPAGHDLPANHEVELEMGDYDPEVSE
jgi:PASTA domain-containing protein